MYVNTTSVGAVLSQYTYTYNAQDFRDSETLTGSAIPPIPTATDAETTYATNALNQLTGTTGPIRTFTYDTDGNLTTGYTKDGYPFVATYDAENRMTALTYTGAGGVIFTTEYVYGGDGLVGIERKYENTVLKQETRFVRDGGLVVQDRNASNAVTSEYTWSLSLGGGIGGLLSLTNGIDGDYDYFYDGSGNVEVVLGMQKQIVAAAYRYDPFGNLEAKTGSLNQPYGFSTKHYDPMLGMIHYEARNYWPAFGKWDRRDPLGEAGGLNLYAFVGNNPVNWVDPWGLSHLPGGPWHPPDGVSTGCSYANTCSELSNTMRLLKKMIERHREWDREHGTNRHETDIQQLINAYNNCVKIHQEKCTQQYQVLQRCAEGAGVGMTLYMIYQLNNGMCGGGPQPVYDPTPGCAY